MVVHTLTQLHNHENLIQQVGVLHQALVSKELSDLCRHLDPVTPLLLNGIIFHLHLFVLLLVYNGTQIRVDLIEGGQCILDSTDLLLFQFERLL